MNQNPEQLARDKIDSELIRSGWLIQSKSKINLNAGLGIAVREYQTDIGPADYVLFVNQNPVGIIEAKRAEEGVHLTMHEGQSEGYADDFDEEELFESALYELLSESRNLIVETIQHKYSDSVQVMNFIGEYYDPTSEEITLKKSQTR